jgi:hypothetical protein
MIYGLCIMSLSLSHRQFRLRALRIISLELSQIFCAYELRKKRHARSTAGCWNCKLHIFLFYFTKSLSLSLPLSHTHTHTRYRLFAVMCAFRCRL